MISLDHIGVAVSDLPRSEKLFNILGLKIARQEEVRDQGVRAHFIPLRNDIQDSCHLELLEVCDSEGAISKFIQKRGPGIHHLSFLLEKGELEKVCEQLVQSGYPLVYPKPRMGAQNYRINFIHPRAAGGILIELMEPVH